MKRDDVLLRVWHTMTEGVAMPYTLDDYDKDLDDLHKDQLEIAREEASELEAYFSERDPFYCLTEDVDDAAWLKEVEVDGWFEPEQADLDAAFERDLWLGAEED